MVHNELGIGALMGNTQFPRTDKRKKFLHTLFTDAIETGIGTWAIAKEYHWGTDGGVKVVDDVDDFYAILVPASDDDKWGFWEGKEDKQELRVDIDTIERGLMRYWEYVMGERDKMGYSDNSPNCDHSQLGIDAINQDSYWFQLVIMDLTNGEYGDYDAMTLSAVLELALFDELVYA